MIESTFRREMSLALFPDSSDTRGGGPRYSLLKWIGNKKRFAGQIISYFPERFGAYFEPFVGSGAVLATLAPRTAIASDCFAPLIDIWTALKHNPESLKTWYRERWDFVAAGDKVQRYELLKRSYNDSPNAADLLFLCRSCYGGVIRFRKADGFMSTPCGPHNPIRPEAFGKRVDEWSQRIQGTEFRLADYSEIMHSARAGDLVYCDPPYVDTQKILYGAQGFDLAALLRCIAECKRRSVRVALSIDGAKRSSKSLLDLDLPRGLFQREIVIEGPASMLKRFQSRGENLDHEKVSERLLLTY